MVVKTCTSKINDAPGDATETAGDALEGGAGALDGGEVGAVAHRTTARAGGRSIGEVLRICAPVVLVCHLVAIYICGKVRLIVKGVGGRTRRAAGRDEGRG